MSEPLSAISLPPVTLRRSIDLNANVRILVLDGTSDDQGEYDATTSQIVVLTLGHSLTTLLFDAELPSAFVSLSQATRWIALPPPWKSFRDDAGTSYSNRLYARSAANLTASGKDSALSALLLNPDAVGPIRFQSLDAFESSASLPTDLHPSSRPLGALSRRVMAATAQSVDPALLRPIGDVTTLPNGLVDLVQHLAGPTRPPLFIGAQTTRLPEISGVLDSSWRNEGDITTRLIIGPGLIANGIIWATLGHHQSGEGRGQEEMRWVQGAGASLPRGGNRGGQPDFICEWRAGPEEPWTVLVVCQTKTFVASPLLVALLREITARGSARLKTDPSQEGVRPAWDRLVMQLAQQVASSGAHCAAVWTGLDWLIFDREKSETAAVSLRVWPRLLRAVCMRDGSTHESGISTEPGLTRHNDANLPSISEEESGMNEAGILVSLGLHALRRSRGTVFARKQLLGQPKGFGLSDPRPLSAIQGSPTGAAGGDSLGNLFYDPIPLGSGTFSTVHRAGLDSSALLPTSSLDLPYMAKLARERPEPYSEHAGMWPDTETGPGSFAAFARRSLARETAAYYKLENLQGSVLAHVIGAVPVANSTIYEDEQDDGAGSSHSESAQMPAAVEATTLIQLPEHGLEASCTSDPTTNPPSSSDEARLSLSAQGRDVAPGPPSFIHAIIMTFAGHSLRNLVVAGQPVQVQDYEVPLGTPSLRSLLADAGLTSRAAASSWLRTELVKALQSLHARGIAHGDVSGGNVCLDATRSRATPSSISLRLIDLGGAVFEAADRDRFTACVEQDLYRAHDVVRRAIAEAWSSDDRDDESSSSSTDSQSRTPTMMPVDLSPPYTSA